MHYPDGQEIKAGDKVRIGRDYEGTVVACISTGDYLPSQEHWSYLGTGLMVDTTFGGLVHYADEALFHSEEVTLLRRRDQSA